MQKIPTSNVDILTKAHSCPIKVQIDFVIRRIYFNKQLLRSLK